MIRVQIDYANACCGKELPNNTANLPKYAVQGRGATKPPVPESPHTASYLFCVAIAARAQFEGVTTFDSYRACV